MFAIVLLPVLVLAGIDNKDFLDRVTDAEWQWVGPTERAPGVQADGSAALTIDGDGTSYILFKQKPQTPPQVAGDDTSQIAEDSR